MSQGSMDNWCMIDGVSRDRCGCPPEKVAPVARADSVAVDREALEHVVGVAARGISHDYCELCVAVYDALHAAV